MQPECQNCKFFRKFNTEYYGIENTIGRCHRYAPRPTSERDAESWGWPIVSVDDWCGDFQGKE